MCRLALSLVLVAGFLFGMSPEISFSADPPSNKQTGEYHDANGEYTIKLRAEKSVIDPGELLKIEIYLTGYGEIHRYKLNFSPSANISDIRKSEFLHIEALYYNGTNFIGKSKSETFTQSGYYIERKLDFRNDAFIFGNVDKNDSTFICSELKNGVDDNGLAPFELNIKTLDDVTPGKYSIYFIFTYYNGKEWKISEKQFEFVVRNFWQRHEQYIIWSGTFAAILTIIASIITISSSVFQYVKKKRTS